MKPRSLPIFTDPKARAVLEAACRKHGVSMQLFRDLLEVQRNNAGRARSIGITDEFDEQLNEFLER